MKTLTPNGKNLLLGMLGVIGFSITLPATRLAVVELDPTFVGLGRAVVAAIFAGLTLLAFRAPLPIGRQWLRLGGTALGVVVGFPLLSAWAMMTVPAAHGAVFVGLLPLATALFGAALSGERPRFAFWVSTLIGSLTIALFSLSTSGGNFQAADILMLGAVIAAGYGYAEGARLSRELGAWQTISWALVVSAPVLLVPTLATMPHDLSIIGWKSAAGFAYVAVISMFLAFVVWYKGLAMGGTARVGQLQLLQPFLTILVAALLLEETITLRDTLAVSIVLGCVWVGRRAATAKGL